MNSFDERVIDLPTALIRPGRERVHRAVFRFWGQWQVLGVMLLGVIWGNLAALSCGSEPQPNAGPASNTVAGRTLDEWRDVIKSLDPKAPEAAKEVEGLIVLMSDEHVPWFTRRQAALTLGRIGEPAARAIPLLVEYATTKTGDQETSTALWAIKALALYGRAGASAAPPLARIVTDPHADLALRMMSIEALCRIGTANSLALSTIVELLRSHKPCLGPEQIRSSEERELVVASIECLELFQGDAESAVPILLRYSEDREDRVRRAVAVTLGAIGPRAVDAATRLAQMTVADHSHDVRDVAATALGKVGGEELLGRILKHSDVEMRERAATALGYSPGRSQGASEALAAARSDESPLVRIAAVEATERWQSNPPLTAPAAARELNASDRHARVRAARFLYKLGAKASPALPVLEEIATSSDPQVRQAAQKLVDSIRQQVTDSK
ncbi:MAG: HEAT repeat domain-containing protein [Planctomycetaceae bacterium]